MTIFIAKKISEYCHSKFQRKKSYLFCILNINDLITSYVIKVIRNYFSFRHNFISDCRYINVLQVNKIMSISRRLKEMKDKAEALEKNCDRIYEEIINIEPFQGPNLNKRLRKIDAEAEKYLNKARAFSELQITVSPQERDEIDELWQDINLSISSCTSTLISARNYLEEESFLVAIINTVKEIGHELRQSLSLMATTIAGLLPEGR